MGAFGRLLISKLGGNINTYNGINQTDDREKRIDNCSHCLQVTNQINKFNPFNNSYMWVCLNCNTYPKAGPCRCGNCHTHPYEQTGLTKKDITTIIEDED